MAVSRLLGRASGARKAAAEAYSALVAQARLPTFYRDCGVPDSLDGRFDMIALHVFLVLRRLKAEGAAAKALSQALLDLLFADLDRSLREMGAGDLGVGRRVKTMVQALYGRIGAYDAALAAGDEAVADALARNLYGTVRPDPAALAAMCGYMRAEDKGLAAQPFARIERGAIAFGAPPGAVAGKGAA